MLEGRFIKAGITGTNRFSRIAPGSTSSRDKNEEQHNLSVNIGYGWFYKNKRSMMIAAGTNITQVNSKWENNWLNSYNVMVEKGSYRNIYHNVLFLNLHQKIDYSYYTDRYYKRLLSASYPSPRLVRHALNFAVSPGITYIYSESLLFQLSLELISTDLTMRENYYEQSESVSRFNYTLGWNYSFSNARIGLVWRPLLIQKKNDL